MNNSSVSNLRRPLALLGVGLSLIAAQAAFGQSTDATAKKDETVKLDKFVVTGSYIPAAVDEALALPVQIIDTSVITQTGQTMSALDVLRKAVPQIVGANNIGSENANIANNSTNGGSQVALRNTSTLVLIDGQRVAFDPVAGSGGNQFVDLNVVPVSAIERIEVLTDGASAIYGSDAVSGVINIILKKNYSGAEVGAYYGFTKSDKTKSTIRNREAHLVAGTSNGKTSITAAVEWVKQDPMYEKQYNYTSPVFLTASYPGVINDKFGQFYKLNSSLTAPPSTPTTLANLVAANVYVPTAVSDVVNGFDLSGRPTFSSALNKEIASLSLEHKISDALTFKAGLLHTKTDTWSQLNPQPIVFKVNSNAGNTGLPGIPFTDPSVTVRNRFLFAGNREYPIDSTMNRFTAEFDGKIADNWTWALDSIYNTSNQTAQGTNQILNSSLQSAIQSGLINLAATVQDPAKVAQANIFGTAIGIYESKLIGYDARVTGTLYQLPTGAISTAAGVGYRKETLSATADMNSTFNPATGTSAWNNGVTINPFNAGRNLKYEFLEVKVPLTSPDNNIPGLHLVSLDGAVRHEAYSDTGGSTVPKVSLRWLPFNDEFAIRSTFGKSFSVPTLYELFGPINSGATPSLSGITSYDANGNAIGTFPNIQGQSQSGSNPTLKPSHSKSYTVGFVYSPKKVKGLAVSVDYFNIKETDIPGALAGISTIIQDVEHFGPASPYVNFVHLDNFGQLGGTKITAPGQLHVNPSNIYVDQFLANVAAQNQSGVDLDAKYTFNNQYGTWTINSNWSYLRSFAIQPSAGGGFVQYVGNNGNGTLPRFREYTTLGWASGAYSASLSNVYIHSVLSASDMTTKIPSFSTFDIQGGCEVEKLVPALKGLRVTVGINNVFNKYPPTDPNWFSDPPADTGLYGSMGRFYYMNASYKF